MRLRQLAVLLCLPMTGCFMTRTMWAHATEKRLSITDVIGFGLDKGSESLGPFAILKCEDVVVEESFNRTVHYYKVYLNQPNRALVLNSTRDRLREDLKNIVNSAMADGEVGGHQFGEGSIVQSDFALNNQDIIRDADNKSQRNSDASIREALQGLPRERVRNVRIIMISDRGIIGKLRDYGLKTSSAESSSDIVLLAFPNVQRRSDAEVSKSIFLAAAATPILVIADIILDPFLYIWQFFAVGTM